MFAYGNWGKLRQRQIFDLPSPDHEKREEEYWEIGSKIKRQVNTQKLA